MSLSSIPINLEALAPLSLFPYRHEAAGLDAAHAQDSEATVRVIPKAIFVYNAPGEALETSVASQRKRSLPMHSMTAFSCQESLESCGQFSWELRSVNHRYLEIMLRLPDEFRQLEPVIRKRIAQCVRRGKLESTLKFKAPPIHLQGIQLNESCLNSLLSATKQIADCHIQMTGFNPIDLLNWPGIMEENQGDIEAARKAALRLFNCALEQFCNTRQNEGKNIKPLLQQRCQVIRQEISQLRHDMPDILANQRQRLCDRAQALNISLDEGRLEQEVAIIAQRIDVDEEIDRIELHIDEVDRLLGISGPVGRRLDFLMQELNREANTLASKSLSIKMTHAAVELKVAIEQMREQIQNVE